MKIQGACENGGGAKKISLLGYGFTYAINKSIDTPPAKFHK
jgi:hypothetical protein